MCFCACWDFCPFAAFTAQPWGLWKGRSSSGPAHPSAPRPHRVSASEPQHPCPCTAASGSFLWAQRVDLSPSCPEGSFVSPSPGMPSALCSDRFHLLPARPWVPLSRPSAHPWCQRCSVPGARNPLDPRHLRSAVAGHLAQFSLPKLPVLVGGFVRVFFVCV